MKKSTLANSSTAHVIETRYRGYRFRSRLEARWAVFLNANGLDFEYEPEAFCLDGMNYLPDFWIPALGCFLEIKPNEPNARERECALRLAKHTRKSVIIAIGMPRHRDEMKFDSDDVGFNNLIRFSGDYLPEEEYYGALSFCACHSCGLVVVNHEGKQDNLPCACASGGNNRMKIEHAIDAARGYRFEPLVIHARN